MAPEPKPPYKLTIKLAGARPERIAEALQALQECVSSHDQTGETGATAVIECWKEADAIAVADAFEDWQYRHAIGLDSKMDLQRPGVRPETIAARLREKHQTPMDKALDDVVTPGGRAVEWLEAREQRGDSVTLSHNGRSVTLDAETARNASAMLRDTDAFEDEEE